MKLEVLMGSVNNKQIRNLHARNYIQAVFADRLKEEGFVCPNDKLLCWYRVVNNELIQSIYFFSQWSNLPLMMEIGYGIHPTYHKPFSSSDVYISNQPYDERFYTVAIGSDLPVQHYSPYSPDILVYAPKNDGSGITTLDHVVLPTMNSIKSVEECYRFHRKMYCHSSFGMSTIMIDEAIQLGNTAAFPNCNRALDKMISVYGKNCEQYPSKKEYQDKLQYARHQKAALLTENRKAYMDILEQRSAKNLQQLKKWGILI